MVASQPVTAAVFILSLHENRIRHFHLQQSLFQPLATVLATRGISKSATYRFTNTHTRTVLSPLRPLHQTGNTNPHAPSLKMNICKTNELLWLLKHQSHNNPELRNGIQEAGC